jgi:RNA polymerase sigma-70 factor (ECF subfamily)
MQTEANCLSEGEALSLAQQGNSAAFDFLYRLHSQRVYALCLRMVKNPAQAEDLTQETFLAVLRGIRGFHGQSAFTTWLYQVTRNTVLMCFRKKRLKETSLEEIGKPDRESGRPPTELGSPDRHLESTADRILLQTAVARLSRGFRATLVLHDLHGYEHSEVAAILGCAPGTSKSQLHKARVRIREIVRKCLHGNSHNGKRLKNDSGAEFESIPAPATDQFDSESEKASKPDYSTHKVDNAIPSWCVQIDEKTPSARK